MPEKGLSHPAAVQRALDYVKGQELDPDLAVIEVACVAYHDLDTEDVDITWSERVQNASAGLDEARARMSVALEAALAYVETVEEADEPEDIPF